MKKRFIILIELIIKMFYTKKMMKYIIVLNLSKK